MANRYWVGGTGNWSDTAHWSTASGGTGGASLPTSADNVYFDGNSFTVTGQTVTVDAAANCLDMEWTGALHSPTLTGGSTLSIFGSLILISTITVTLTQKIILASTLSGNNITTAGVFLPCSIDFNGTGGEWILQDDITITALYGAMGIYRGTLNTNNKTITVFSLVLNGSSSTRGLNLSSSDIVLSGHFSNSSTVGLTFNAGTSTIKLTGNSKTFAGGGLTYNNVEFQGDNCTITGSNTFNELKVNSGKTLKLTAGTTQTVNKLTADGASIQSATAGSAANVKKLAGELIVDHASIKDITAIATAIAKYCTDLGGNTGWIWWGWKTPVVNRENAVKYDESDLNRVGMNMAYLAELLNGYGYEVNITQKLDWVNADINKDNLTSQILTGLQALEDAYYTLTSTPAPPASMASLFWYDANNIEQILLDINTLLENMIAQFKYSDTFYCGEV